MSANCNQLLTVYRGCKKKFKYSQVETPERSPQSPQGERPNWVCQVELRDPLTNVYSFLYNPSPLRLSCTFLAEAYDHCIYLEIPCLPRPNLVELLPRGEGDALRSNTTPGMSRTTTHEEVEDAPGLSETRHDSWVLDVDGGNDATGRNIPVCFRHLSTISQTGLSSSRKEAGSPEPSSSFPSSPPPTLYKLLLRGLPGIMHSLSDDLKLGPRIQQLTISGLSHIVEVGQGAFANCALKEVVFEDMPNLTKIGDWFLGWCGLEKVRIARLPQLELVGDYFLASCTQLMEVTIHDVPELTSVGQSWLGSCMRLEKVQLANLPKLQRIGNSFLTSCPKLREVAMVELPKLASVGSHWLFGASAQQVRFVFAGVPRLEEIGENAALLSSCCTTDGGVEFGQDCHPKLRSLFSKSVTM